ncbi:MAG: glutathione binding-like protein [Pseudomonadota bacterium]
MKKPLVLAAFALAIAACTASPVEQVSTKVTDTSAAPMVAIYHLEGRRSERIVWLMEELGLPYDLNYVRGDLRGSMAMVHALGHEMPMVPTVVIEDQILVESGAIIDLILSRYATGELTPDVASDDYPVHLMWMHYAEGSLAARLFSDYRAWRTNPPTERSMFVDSEAVVQFAENHLATHPWFGGQDFSSADIMMFFPLNVATGLNLVDAAKFPHIAAWKTKIESRPAYQRMLAAARPDGMIGNLPPVQARPPSERGTR